MALMRAHERTRVLRSFSHIHGAWTCAQVLDDARARSVAEPVRLARNWPLAVVICALWLAGAEAGVYYGMQRWGGCPRTGALRRASTMACSAGVGAPGRERCGGCIEMGVFYSLPLSVGALAQIRRSR
eukprot:133397-Chlamydomonas_euryale.AAC.1